MIEGDGLPPYICQKCISKLNNAFQFKTQCESSDAKLRQCFQQYQNMPPAPDLAGFIEIKKVDSNETTLFTAASNNINSCLEEKHDSLDLHLNTDIPDMSVVETCQGQILQTVQIDSSGNTLLEIENELKPDLVDLKPAEMNMKVCYAFFLFSYSCSKDFVIIFRFYQLQK